MAPIAALATSALAASNLAARSFSYHDNSVFIDTPSLLGGSFTVEAYSISSGQDPSGHNHVGDVHAITATAYGYTGVWGAITISAGRHKTADVANWWNANVPYPQNTFDHNADALNFAFLGTLVLHLQNEIASTVTFRHIGLAQGSDSNGSNWWFGGQTCSSTTQNNVQCTGTDQDGHTVSATFTRGGSSNTINDVLMGPITWG